MTSTGPRLVFAENASILVNKDIKDLYVIATIFNVATANPSSFCAACVCTEAELWPGGLIRPQTLIRGTNSETCEGAMQSLGEMVAKTLDVTGPLAAGEELWPTL